MARVALRELTRSRTLVRAVDRNVAIFGERPKAENVSVERDQVLWDDFGNIEARPVGGRVPQNLWINYDVVRVEDVRIEALRPRGNHLLEAK